MKAALVFVAVAIGAYLIGAINWSIVFARVFYHEDIRKVGSGNPGFTNFKRTYGNKLAWFVWFLDMSKGAIVGLVSMFLFLPEVTEVEGLRQIGIAYAGLFAMIGNCYPVYYQFKGGKGFSVAMGIIWFIDWRAGLIGTAIMMSLLFTVRWMSLSVMVSCATWPISIALFGAFNVPPAPYGAWGSYSWIAPVINALAVALLVYRHKGNIAKIISGTERKFYLKKKKEEPAPEAK